MKKLKEEKLAENRTLKVLRSNIENLNNYLKMRDTKPDEQLRIQAIHAHLLEQENRILRDSIVEYNLSVCVGEYDELLGSEAIKLYLSKHEEVRSGKRKSNNNTNDNAADVVTAEPAHQRRNRNEMEVELNREEDSEEIAEKELAINFEEDEIEETARKERRKRQKKKQASIESSDSESREEGEIVEDEEDYDSKICGPMDPAIAIESRIQVYWAQEKEWRKGTVKKWNDQFNMYEIDYDHEKDEEPVLEHLTGPSKEKWMFIRSTRSGLR
jgi:hypothetical protein